MLAVSPDGGGGIVLLPPAPPPPAPQPVPPPPAWTPVPPPPPPPAPAPASAVNAHGETLAQAEAAIRAEVATGVPPSVALADHPLPAGSVTATQALDFLASLPQSVTPIADAGAGVVTGPPIDTLPGYDPATHSINPAFLPPQGGAGVDVGGTDDGDRTLESAYRPPGVIAQWRNIVDVFKNDVPKTNAAVDSANKALLGVFK